MGSKSKNKKKDETPVDTSALRDGRGRGGVTDERFLSANFDPKFQNVPKQKSKVKIDDRFQRLFTDASFSSSAAPTDKRGRPKKKDGDSERSSLKHYYRIGEEEEDDEEVKKEAESEEGGVDDVAKAGELSDDDGDDNDDDEEEEEEEEEESSDLEEESATMDTEDESGSDEEDEEGDDLEESVPTIDEETHRLAVVNLDWRHVRAVDLYVLLSSFLPKNGRILSVTIYPSEFGLQRMKEEELHGPVGLFKDDKSDDDDEDKNGDIDNEKLRAYERNRMRYYYAVVECDSSATGDHLYKTCDGDELGRSANVLDLRFIPDSMEFEHPPHDKATEVPENYDAKDFETRALQQSKIHLTWDEDEPDRVRTLKRNFNADQLADLEVKDFLASDDSESDSEDNRDVLKDQSDKKGKKIDKYRALLEEGNGSDGDGEDGNRDMEITFNTGLEDLSKRLMEKKDKKSETVWEAYLRKRREKKKARKNKSENSSHEESSDADREVIEEPDDFFLEEPPVKRSKKEKGHGKTKKSGKETENADAEGAASLAELELLLADDAGADVGPKGYKIKTEHSKRKRGSEDSKIPTGTYNDPRFSALFTHPLYSLDPTHPDFKRSAAYARQFADRRQKGDRHELTKGASTGPTASAELKHEEDDKINKDERRHNSHGSSSTSGKNELSSLVKSVKMKSKLVQLSANGKTSSKKKK